MIEYKIPNLNISFHLDKDVEETVLKLNLDFAYVYADLEDLNLLIKYLCMVRMEMEENIENEKV